MFAMAPSPRSHALTASSVAGTASSGAGARRVHSVHNLFVAGSAAFPTSSQANPTLTLIALSLRLARHLARGLAPHAALELQEAAA